MTGPPLVTGATGFAGSHLLDVLTQEGEVVAAWANPAGKKPAARNPRVAWREVDVLDSGAVRTAIAELRPSAVYHCAGAADVGGAWSEPAQALRLNAMGTHYVLEALRAAEIMCPVLVTGSALIYRPSSGPLSEDSAIGPTTPYGLSKLAQEMLAERATACPVLLARSFNHAGPRQSDTYVTSNFARQIAEIEAGLHEPVLRVGNIDSRRDITDVRDTVRAYRRLVASGTPRRPYNVCSGVAYRIGDLLQQLLGLASVDIRIDVDPARLRPSDTPLLIGDPSRIEQETGWHAEIPIDRTLVDLLNYWRQTTSRPAVPRL